MFLARLVVLILLISSVCATTVEAKLTPAITEAIPVSQFNDFRDYPPAVKKLLNKAAELSQKKLTYLYGSADPKNGGMDCSGTIYYLLKNSHIEDVPRQSNEMYTWVEKNGTLHKVVHQDNDSTELSKLKPGDLLFWSGTYDAHHSPNITHVMIYLGKNKENEPLMFGSSDGRYYQGKKMWGVSVFDFRLSDKYRGKFEGYSCIPQLTCEPI